MTQFFRKFPIIDYNGTPAVNLLARVKMSKLGLKNNQAYYPYSVKEGERLDNLAHNYYGNPDYFWLVGLANSIIDPYYDFPVAEQELNQLIANKYNSITNAKNIILFFRTNWRGDDSRISTAAYAALGVGRQKYWAPEINENNTIISYVRKQEDWIVTTNKIQNLSYDYSVVDNEFVNVLTEDNYEIMTENDFNIIVDYIPETVTDKKFVAGELVSQSNVVFASVETASENVLVIKNIVGTAVTGVITGLASGASGSVTAVTTLSQSIPANELVYWTPVTAYDYESELNAEKKQIQLLNNRLAEQATTELKTLLST
jgi:hypothetical protein